jgi:membrane protein required for colicin V production
MQLYDLIFLGALLFSIFMGATRGGVREIITLIAFFVAIFVAIYSKPILAKTFNLELIGSYIAAGGIFVASYFGIRYLGQSLSDRLHKQKTTSYIDRALGVGFGVIRAIVFLGVFHLIFSSVTPIERQPRWFSAAKVYPLGVWSAKTVQKLMPQGTSIANKVAPSIESNTKNALKP